MARAFSLALFNARSMCRALRLFLRIRAAAPLRRAIFALLALVYKVSILSAARLLARQSGTSAV